MQQLAKIHKKRVEYRTVNLVYWNGEEAALIDAPDLFNLTKIYPGEAIGFTFLTRNFDLNLGDKNPSLVRIHNFSVLTPYFNNENSADNEMAINYFNQTVILNCELFESGYGGIPISLKTDLTFDNYVVGTHPHVYGSYMLNELDFTFTPTKTLNSLNNVSFTPIGPGISYGPGIPEQNYLFLPMTILDTNIWTKIFTLSFVVELHYDN